MKYNVYVRPKSQLGNVMFLYAFCNYYASKYNMTPYMSIDCIPLWWKDYSKTFLFDKGNIINHIPTNYYTIKPQKYSREYINIDHINNNHILLEGLFQSPKYWNNDKDFIYNLFDVPDALINDIKSLYQDVDFDNTISIHMRRTDFFDYMSKYVNTYEYISNIINKYLSDEKKFIILSDDLAWCKNNMKDDRFIFADRLSSNHPKFIIDMFLMTLCKGNIVNNVSTFSWWGSYLNRNKDRKVYYSSKCGTLYDFIPENDNWIDTEF